MYVNIGAEPEKIKDSRRSFALDAENRALRKGPLDGIYCARKEKYEIPALIVRVYTKRADLTGAAELRRCAYNKKINTGEKKIERKNGRAARALARETERDQL